MPITNYLQLYFIRHGQSANNLLYVQTGSDDGRNSDPELTDTGRRQAQRLAEFIQERDMGGLPTDWDNQNQRGFGFTHLYCSLMVRAVETATYLSEALGLPVVAWEELHETGGIYLNDPETGERVGLAGKPRSYFQKEYPRLQLPESLGESGWWNRPFEEKEERMARAQRFLAQLLARHGNCSDRVAVISHAGFYNRFLAAILEMERRTPLWFSLNNTGITRIDYAQGEMSMVYSNQLQHLPHEMVT